jgi:hypothetical protein
MRIEATRTGRAAIWESGGGLTNRGHAVLVTDPHGGPKIPLFVKTSGDLACGNHALIPVAAGDCIISVRNKLGEGKVERITAVGPAIAPQPNPQGLGAGLLSRAAHIDLTTELVAEYETGEWSPELPDQFQAAWDAACRKARTYHCRSAVYIAEVVPVRRMP